MKQYAIEVGGHQINVHRWGDGPNLIIALHGFGRSGQRFADLGERLRERYTFCAPDLPFHGNTRWASPHYSLHDCRAIIHAIAAHEAHPTLTLIGHSLGGRLALRTSPELDDYDIRRLILVAPDGLRGPYTHWIDRTPRLLGRRLAKLLDRPQGVLRFVKLLRHRRLLNPYTEQYLQHNLQNETFRRRLQGTFLSLPDFRLQALPFRQKLRDLPFPVDVFVGRHDPIIDVAHVQRLLGGLPHVQIHVLARGHEIPAPEIAGLLYADEI